MQRLFKQFAGGELRQVASDADPALIQLEQLSTFFDLSAYRMIINCVGNAPLGGDSLCSVVAGRSIKMLLWAECHDFETKGASNKLGSELRGGPTNGCRASFLRVSLAWPEAMSGLENAAEGEVDFLEFSNTLGNI